MKKVDWKYVTEVIWTYYDLGLVSETNFEGFAASICSRLTTQGGRRYWQNEARFFSSSLGDYVDATCY